MQATTNDLAHRIDNVAVRLDTIERGLAAADRALGEALKSINAQLVGLQRLTNRVLEKEKTIMAFGQETLDLMKQVDAATTDVADRIQKLIDAQASAPTEEEKAKITAAINAELDRLRGLGRDPNNPIPPAPPTPAPAAGKRKP